MGHDTAAWSGRVASRGSREQTVARGRVEDACALGDLPPAPRDLPPTLTAPADDAAGPPSRHAPYTDMLSFVSNLIVTLSSNKVVCAWLTEESNKNLLLRWSLKILRHILYCGAIIFSYKMHVSVLMVLADVEVLNKYK